jgi:hypothetical protein
MVYPKVKAFILAHQPASTTKGSPVSKPKVASVPVKSARAATKTAAKPVVKAVAKPASRPVMKPIATKVARKK